MTSLTMNSKVSFKTRHKLFLKSFYNKPNNLFIFPILVVSSAGLLATTISLDFRVTALEENGGDDWNSSIAELEVRVEKLEGTTADHETRISAAETDINGR